jgi:hypothetical protein
MEVNCENVSFQKMFAAYRRFSHSERTGFTLAERRTARLANGPSAKLFIQLPFQRKLKKANV